MGGAGADARTWWKRPQFLLLAAGAALLTAYSVSRDHQRVGGWISADSKAQYIEAYRLAFQRMPEPAEELDLKTDFGGVRVYRFAGSGQGLPTVLLPGRGGASPTLAVNIPPLLEFGDVYSLDLLGEPGISVQEQPITDDADQARWLHQALKQLPADQFHLMGVSIGGWTAANLARHQPETIHALTLVDPVYVFDDIPPKTVLRSIPTSVPLMPQSWRDSFNAYIANGAPPGNSPEARMLEVGQRTYKLRLPAPHRISEAQLKELTMPVLAVIAGHSVMLDPQRASEVAGRVLPQGRVRIYQGASHVVNAEQPEKIADDVASFLRPLMF